MRFSDVQAGILARSEFQGICNNREKRTPLPLGMPVRLGIWPFVNSCKWFHSAYRHVHFYPRV